MAARRGGVMLGAGALAGRSIPCDFVGAPPFPANGDIPALNPAGEANRLDDVVAPLRKVENAACAEYFEDALFLAVAPYFAALQMAILRLVPDRQGLERRFEAWLVALELEQRLATGRLHRRDGLDLAMHRIGGAQHAGQAEFADQHLYRRNFVALHHDRDVPEDDLRAHRERPEQLRHLGVTGRVVAAFQALAVMRDPGPPSARHVATRHACETPLPMLCRQPGR